MGRAVWARKRRDDGMGISLQEWRIQLAVLADPQASKRVRKVAREL